MDLLNILKPALIWYLVIFVICDYFGSFEALSCYYFSRPGLTADSPLPVLQSLQERSEGLEEIEDSLIVEDVQLPPGPFHLVPFPSSSDTDPNTILYRMEIGLPTNCWNKCVYFVLYNLIKIFHFHKLNIKKKIIYIISIINLLLAPQKV